ncbi:MAG: TRAP transporter large permease [Burkholderiaceae bacterium]|jgi:tripartite ATP-independent transporter DctM subunit|nr:TRAP transporter large permease [Burkholderiaceae bacterium]
MSALTIGMLGIVALFLLILLQVPVGIAMLVVGVCGYAAQTGWGPALAMLANEPSTLMSSVDLATVPLFLLMGTFATAAGFSSELYNAAAAVLGHRRGGLAYATAGGSAVFGAICGSSTATAATFTKAALPEMLQRGYSPSFAAGTIAAGGALKSLIPPSVTMILYCVATKTFIFDLFAASIVPALLTIAFNLVTIAVIVRVWPQLAPVAARVPWSQRWPLIVRALPVLGLVAVLFFGLYSGIFTVNEAASVAAVLSFVFAALRGRLSWEAIGRGMRDCATASAMIYTIIIGSIVFGDFLTLAQVPGALVGLLDGTHFSGMTIIVLLLVIYLVLGSLFDEIAAMLITLPFVLPIIVQLGYDPIWWGVINVIIIEIGMIHPPLGIIGFVLHGLAPQISLAKIYRGVAPFIVADMAVLALLVLFPALALWLPKVMAH